MGKKTNQKTIDESSCKKPTSSGGYIPKLCIHIPHFMNWRVCAHLSSSHKCELSLQLLITHRSNQSCPIQWWHIWFQRGCCWRRRPGTQETRGRWAALGTTASAGWCHCWSSGSCSMGDWWPERSWEHSDSWTIWYNPEKGILCDANSYLGNCLDLNWLSSGLTVIFSQDDTVASGTGEKTTQREWLAEMKTLRIILGGMRDNDLRHAAVSSSDNPVLADQRSSTEVESSTVLVWGKFTFIKWALAFNWRGWGGRETVARIISITWSETCHGQDPDTAFCPFTILL